MDPRFFFCISWQPYVGKIAMFCAATQGYYTQGYLLHKSAVVVCNEINVKPKII